MTKSLEPQDYKKYRFRGINRWVLFVKIFGILICLGWFFYQSFWASVLLAPIGIFVAKREGKRKLQEMKNELTGQFVECLQAVSVSMHAGYSVENSFLESEKDMESFYGKESLIFAELECIRRGLALHESLEELLFQLAEKTQIGDLKQFAQIFSIAKKRGGDMTGIISNTVEQIRQRVETREEIRVLLSGKEMEQKVMECLPFGILCYIGVTYPGYFTPLYHNLPGIAIMSFLLAVYMGACALNSRILESIEKEIVDMQGIQEEKKLKIYESGIMGKTTLWLKKWPLGQLCPLRVRKKLEQLYPEEDKGRLPGDYILSKIQLLLMVFFAGCFLGLVYVRQQGPGWELWWLYLLVPVGILILAIALFFLLDKDLCDRAEKRAQSRSREYPEIVHKLVLYMGAGLSVRGCFGLLAKEYDCVLYAYRELQSGMLEPVAYERFGRRIGQQEYIRLGMLLGQNVKKGNADLLRRLEDEALRISRNRQQEAKILGERAQTKLLIPMVMLLVVVMLFIMIPAFLEI